MRVVMLVPGGVDRSGTVRVIPCVLALIERLARAAELHIIALRQEERACEYDLLGARVQCVPRGNRTAAWRAIVRHHREHGIDVLHALWMHPQGTTAALAGALLRIPVLLHLNGGDIASLPDIRFGGRATLAGRTRLRCALAGATHVTVPSAALQRDARRLGIRAERLTFGVALDRWPARSPRPRTPGPARLLSVADFNAVKDHDTLLRAVAAVIVAGQDVVLDCVGADTLRGAARALAADLGIAERVHFHETMPHAQLRDLYDRADVFVVSSRYEGDPVAALEAAVAGVPVVGTAVGHLREWTPDAALTCAPGDAAALALCLQRVLADDVLRLRIAARAQRHALAHDADAAATRLLSIYHALRDSHTLSGAIAS